MQDSRKVGKQVSKPAQRPPHLTINNSVWLSLRDVFPKIKRGELLKAANPSSGLPTTLFDLKLTDKRLLPELSNLEVSLSFSIVSTSYQFVVTNNSLPTPFRFSARIYPGATGKLVLDDLLVTIPATSSKPYFYYKAEYLFARHSSESGKFTRIPFGKLLVAARNHDTDMFDSVCDAHLVEYSTTIRQYDGPPRTCDWNRREVRNQAIFSWACLQRIGDYIDGQRVHILE